MSGLLVWKLLKYIGLVMFSGSLGIVAISGENKSTQWKAVTWGMGIGFLLLWIGGYGMIKTTGLKLPLSWLGYGQFFSIICLFFAYLRFKVSHTKIVLSLSITALIFSLVAMIMKESALYLLRFAAVITLASAVILLFQNEKPIQDDYGKQSWFKFIAWSEAISLIALLFVYMPLKYLASTNLDQGQGWFGWVHGVFQIIFILALAGLAFINKIDRRQFFIGLASSMLPFGTILFDRNISQKKS